MKQILTDNLPIVLVFLATIAMLVAFVSTRETAILQLVTIGFGGLLGIATTKKTETKTGDVETLNVTTENK